MGKRQSYRVLQNEPLVLDPYTLPYALGQEEGVLILTYKPRGSESYKKIQYAIRPLATSDSPPGLYSSGVQSAWGPPTIPAQSVPGRVPFNLWFRLTPQSELVEVEYGNVLVTPYSVSETTFTR